MASAIRPIIEQQTFSSYQPSISDRVKVGFYTCDRASQTEESEIIVLKEATDNLIFLCKEIDVVKYDLKFAKNSIQNQFDSELSNKSIEIYALINEKLKELKKQQEESLDRIRKAYRSQLANAIAKIKKNVLDKKPSLKSNSEDNFEKNQALVKNDYYQQRIKELQKNLVEQDMAFKDYKLESEESIELLKAENEEVVNNLNELKEKTYQESVSIGKKVNRLEEALGLKEEETEKLLSELTNIQLDLEKEKILSEQLSKELQENKLKSEHEIQKIKKDFEKQRIAIETKMHEKMKESREQLVNAAKEELKQQQEAQLEQQQQLILEQQQKQQELLQHQQEMILKEKLDRDREIERLNREKMEQEAYLNEQLTLAEAQQREREKEIKANSSKSSRKEDLELIAKFKSNEVYLKSEVARLNREIQRNNETWEKKFDILKHSLHAIKDEMYLRQNLQKQSVQLAYASVAYTMDEPPSYQQQQQQQQITATTAHINDLKGSKPVLPSIGANKGLDRQLSLTISVPSRLSAHVENDENQILGDDEMDQLKQEYMNDVYFIPAKN